nr:hypothetical protein [uncultured Draconibacterium sp.]
MEAFQYEKDFISALLITILAEVICFFILIRSPYFKEIRKNGWPKMLAVVALATITTLPYLWFILPAFVSDKLWYHIIGEIGVVVIESLIFFLFFKIHYRKMLLLAFLCNLFSYLLGLLI